MKGFRCEHLTKRIGEFLLSDVNFTLEPGLVLGVIGLNGCGKTTLLRTILGSYRLDQSEEDAGELWLGDLHFRENVKEYRESLAYVLKGNPFSEFMHPLEIGERYGYYYPGFDKKKYKELLRKYEVPEKEMINMLSDGQVLRMQLAFAGSYPAKLYVFDEPVGNLDVEFRDDFYEIVRELVKGEESSVIISSHLVTELEHVADKLLWLGKEDGKGFVRYFGTLDDLTNSHRIAFAKDEATLPERMIRGRRIRENHKEYLLYDEAGDFGKLGEDLRLPDLQEIMYFTEKESKR